MSEYAEVEQLFLQHPTIGYVGYLNSQKGVAKR